jgi:PhoH-like ATPase
MQFILIWLDATLIMQKLFILDTNVLMHDPSALFRFQEHDVYLPMVVLEELDAAKKGMSEVARNVRQVSRFLDELVEKQPDLTQGVALPSHENGKSGRLYFQTQVLTSPPLPDSLPGQKSDNNLLNTAIALRQQDPQRQVVLVSKDINLRIKAHVLGIHVEDYTNDKVIDDVDLLYRGMVELTEEFWQTHTKKTESKLLDGREVYSITGKQVAQWYPNQAVYMQNGSEGFVKKINETQAIVHSVKDFRMAKQNVWGITARNREQNFALNLLTDPDVDFVTLLGVAGTGKTLLALAAGLAQTLDQQRYREIIITRVTIPVGEDIGFLPGTEEEKMTPWMGALLDNLEVLMPEQEGGNWGRAVTTEMLQQRIKIRSLNFMRGRTFLNRYIILDEAQNLTSKQMKTFVTRAGPGTKIVCLGNIAQIDTPYLTETTSGLAYVVDRFKSWQYSGHITLQRGERSRLADFATHVL